MSKTLNALMRLKRMEMDNLRQEINRLLDAIQKTIAVIEEVNRQRLNEKIAMQENLGNIAFLKSYYEFQRSSEQELIRLHDIKKRQEQSLSTLQDQMRELFSDYKKYDIIKENKINNEKYQQNRMDNNFLDDIAGQRAANNH